MKMDNTFFLYSFGSLAVCILLTLLIQLITKGKAGKKSIVLLTIIALFGSFLAIHKDNIGEFTREDWIRKTAVVSIIIQAFLTAGFGRGIGDAIYHKLVKPASPKTPVSKKTTEYEPIKSANPSEPNEEFACPDGSLHDFEETREWHDLGFSDDDDMKARKGYYEVIYTCKKCGYSYRKKV